MVQLKIFSIENIEQSIDKNYYINTFSLLYFIISIVVGIILWAIFFNDINLLEVRMRCRY